jgi:hypothetical protein
MKYPGSATLFGSGVINKNFVSSVAVKIFANMLGIHSHALTMDQLRAYNSKSGMRVPVPGTHLVTVLRGGPG